MTADRPDRREPSFSAWAVIGLRPDGFEDLLDIGKPEDLGPSYSKFFDSPHYDSVYKRDLNQQPLRAPPMTEPTEGSTPEPTTVPDVYRATALVCRRVRDSLPKWRGWFPNERSEVEIARADLLLLVAAAEQREKLAKACRSLMAHGVAPEWPAVAVGLWDLALNEAEAALKDPPPL